MFFLICSSPFSRSTLSFLLAAPLVDCRCIWPEAAYDIPNHRYEAHTVFSQHSNDNLRYEVSLSEVARLPS